MVPGTGYWSFTTPNGCPKKLFWHYSKPCALGMYHYLEKTGMVDGVIHVTSLWLRSRRPCWIKSWNRTPRMNGRVPYMSNQHRTNTPAKPAC